MRRRESGVWGSFGGWRWVLCRRWCWDSWRKATRLLSISSVGTGVVLGMGAMLSILLFVEVGVLSMMVIVEVGEAVCLLIFVVEVET